MVTFKNLNYSIDNRVNKIKIDDTTELEVRTYLPIKEKTEFLSYIVSSALDDTTGCFSPLRVNVYYTIAICKWYGGIDFEGETDIEYIYDILESNGIADMIISAIPEEEIEFINDIVEDTVDDISRYNSSAAGIINTMSTSAEGLDGQIRSILDEIKSEDSLKLLKSLKAEVKKD